MLDVVALPVSCARSELARSKVAEARTATAKGGARLLRRFMWLVTGRCGSHIIDGVGGRIGTGSSRAKFRAVSIRA